MAACTSRGGHPRWKGCYSTVGPRSNGRGFPARPCSPEQGDSMAHPALRSPVRLLARALLAFAFLAVLPAGAQDSMQQLRQQLAADKKQMVTANMELTAQEAAAFWPVYDQYQKE